MPCTGAVLILLYAIANDILFAGVLLVVAIAAGMALTMGALGVLSIVARNAVAARVEGAGHGNGRALAVVSDYGGALADHRDRRRAVLVGVVARYTRSHIGTTC